MKYMIETNTLGKKYGEKYSVKDLNLKVRLSWTERSRKIHDDEDAPWAGEAYGRRDSDVRQ